jgi:predicted  nucleic acid-binding Zn-ribbon protein
MSEELKHYTNEWDDWDNTKTPFGELQDIATKLKLENDALRKRLEDNEQELQETMHGFVLQREAFIKLKPEFDILHKQLKEMKSENYELLGDYIAAVKRECDLEYIDLSKLEDERDALRKQLEVVVEAMKKVDSLWQNDHDAYYHQAIIIIRDALAEINILPDTSEPK